MSKPKLGPWHPASVKPVHLGVYETQDSCGSDPKQPEYRNWNGQWWGAFDDSPEQALRVSDIRGRFLVAKWRGLDEQPK